MLILGLQGQAVFKTKLTFRPHSTESQTHKKMIMSMVDKSAKKGTIKVISSVRILFYKYNIYFMYGLMNSVLGIPDCPKNLIRSIM